MSITTEESTSSAEKPPNELVAELALKYPTHRANVLPGPKSNMPGQIECTPPAREQKKGFRKLGPHFLLSLFNYLPVKADQRALTLTTRKTYFVLLPKLYHTMNVDISRYPSLMLPFMNMLNQENLGVQHIRRVLFDAENLDDRAYPPGALDNLSFLFIKRLRDSSVEEFSWPADYPLKPLHSLMLWTELDDLRNIEIYERTWQEDTRQVTASLSLLENISSLRVSPNSPTGFRNVEKIIRNMGTKIKSLHIDLRTFNPALDAGISEKNGSIRDGITNILFMHALPLQSCSPKMQLRLTRLVLWNVNLRHASLTWTRAVRFSTLREFELSRCLHPDQVLKALGNNSVLQSLKIAHYNPDPEPETATRDELGKTLTRLSAAGCTLKHLWLKLRGQSGIPELKPIALHCGSLETLYLDVCEQGRDVSYSIRDLGTILMMTTPKLRQLGIPWSGEPDVLREVWKYVNPVTLCVIESAGSSAAAGGATAGKHQSQSQNHSAIAQQLQPHFWTHATLNNLLHDAITTKGSPIALKWRVFAHVRTGFSTAGAAGEGTEYCMRSTADVLGKTKEVMVPVQLQELRRKAEEVDILVAEPLVFGPRGRR